MNIIIKQNPDNEEIDMLRAALRAYNQSVGGQTEYHKLYVKAENDDGKLLGGVYGNIAWQWLYIDLLWVHPEQRGNKLGTQLINAIEAEANKHSVYAYYVSTASFQAPLFYQKLGYQICGEIKDLPPGYSTYYLKKIVSAFD